MAKLSAKKLMAREAKRDIAAEIRSGMREVRAGLKPAHRVHPGGAATVPAKRGRQAR